jgi:hypothetical protein
MSGNTDFRMRVLVEGNADAAVQAIVPGLKQIEAAANKSMAAVGEGGRRNTQVMQDLGRVFQDMPYGIMGIANNIQPLVESFNRSREAAGGTSAAIAGILQGLVSPMGLAMVGIPIVTSLSVAFGGKLVDAVSAGSDSIAKLTERLAGVAQYENLTIKIAMSGVEGAKRDLLNLINLRERLAVMQRENKLGDDLVRANNLPNKSHSYGTTGHYFGGGIGGDPVLQGADPNTKDLAVAAARKAIVQYEYETVQKIWGKYDDVKKIWVSQVSFGQTEDLRRLKAAQIDEAAALKHLALLKAGADVASAQNKYDVSSAKEKEALLKKNLSAAKAGSASALKAASLDQSWDQAIKEADKALGKIGLTALPSIEVATARVAKAAEAVTKAEQAPQTIQNERALRTATTELTQAQGELKSTTTAYDTAVKAANMALAKSGESTKDVSAAHADVVAAQGALTDAMKLGSAGTADIVKKTDELTLARTVEGKAIDILSKKGERLSKVFRGVGDIAALFGLNGEGVTGLLSGVNSLSSVNIDAAAAKYEQSDMTASQAKAQAQVDAYAGVAGSLGNLIGGSTGAAISNVASGASTGAAIGSVIPGFGTVAGAIVGGAVGLIGSIFGGNDAHEQALQQERNNALQMTSNIGQMASGGNRLAQAFMASAGYNTTTLADLNSATDYQGKNSSNIGDLLPADLRSAKNVSIFATATLTAHGQEQEVLDYLTAFGEFDKALKSMSSTSIVGTLDQISYKYADIIAKIGASADLQQAKLNEQITAITGITADSIGQLIADAVNADTNGSAGKAFADKFELSIATAIKNMAISNLVNSAIMPVLQPVMASLVSGLMAGTLTTTGMASMFEGVKVVADQLQPVISALSKSFVTAGLGGTSSALSTVSAGGYSSFAAYRLAQAGIPSFASGGTFIAGDAGPEIVRISAGSGARIYSNSDTRRMFDNANVVAELKALREEMRSGQYAIAKSCAKTAQWIEKWEKDGLPATTTAL